MSGDQFFPSGQSEDAEMIQAELGHKLQLQPDVTMIRVQFLLKLYVNYHVSLGESQ